MSSKKKRKSLSDSGTGKTYSDLGELIREMEEDDTAEDDPEGDTGSPKDEERTEGAGRGGGSRADADSGDTDGPDPGRDTGESEASESTSEERHSEGQPSETYESRTGRMTFHLPRRLMERLRNAVYWTPAGVTLSSLAREALRAAVERIEEKYNDGEPFPPRDDELTGGRPPGT